jgi:hypothetical protein
MTTAFRQAFSDSAPRVQTDEDTAAPEQEEPFDEFDAAYADVDDPVPDTGEVPTEAAIPLPFTKPENPWAGKVKALSSTWGTSIHERSDFAPTTKVDYHGVWGTKKIGEVRNWVSQARDSINADDEFVVASKPGEDGDCDFLVDMDGQTVGYISGSRVAPGTAPEARHVAVHVNKKGYVDAAFPCTPEMFQAT